MQLKCSECDYHNYRHGRFLRQAEIEKLYPTGCPKCGASLFFAVSPKRLDDEFEYLNEVRLQSLGKRKYRDIGQVDYDPRLYLLRSRNDRREYVWFTYWVTGRDGNLRFGGQYAPILLKEEFLALMGKLRTVDSSLAASLRSILGNT